MVILLKVSVGLKTSFVERMSSHHMIETDAVRVAPAFCSRYCDQSTELPRNRKGAIDRAGGEKYRAMRTVQLYGMDPNNNNRDGEWEKWVRWGWSLGRKGGRSVAFIYAPFSLFLPLPYQPSTLVPLACDHYSTP